MPSHDAASTISSCPQVSQNPPWFVALVWGELLLQLPFFFVATYAFIYRKNWIRIPALVRSGAGAELDEQGKGCMGVDLSGILSAVWAHQHSPPLLAIPSFISYPLATDEAAQLWHSEPCAKEGDPRQLIAPVKPVCNRPPRASLTHIILFPPMLCLADLWYPHCHHPHPYLGPAPDRRQHQAGHHLCTLLLHPAIAGGQDGGVTGAIRAAALGSSQEAPGQDALGVLLLLTA